MIYRFNYHRMTKTFKSLSYKSYKSYSIIKLKTGFCHASLLLLLLFVAFVTCNFCYLPKPHFVVNTPNSIHEPINSYYLILTTYY